MRSFPGLLCAMLFAACLTTYVRADLVLRYELNGNVNDSSGNGNNGTATNTLQFDAGSALFNNPTGGVAATDFISIPDNFASLETSSFSIAMLMRSIDTAQTNGRLFGNNFTQGGVVMGYNRAASANAGILARDSTLNGAGFFDNAAGPEALVTDGQWHWIGLVVDRGSNTAYGFIDNTIVSQSFTGIGAISLSNLRLGAVSDPAEPYLYSAKNTWVDDFRIYNHALSNTEITSLGITAVPEPSSAMLVVIAGIGLLTQRRRSKV